jgi:hypothetical protein
MNGNQLIPIDKVHRLGRRFSVPQLTQEVTHPVSSDSAAPCEINTAFAGALPTEADKLTIPVNGSEPYLRVSAKPAPNAALSKSVIAKMGTKPINPKLLAQRIISTEWLFWAVQSSHELPDCDFVHRTVPFSWRWVAGF